MSLLEALGLANNPVFSGGFGLAVVAVGASALRTTSRIAIELLRRKYLVTLEVTSKDKAYPWVLQWLSSQGAKTQHLSVDTVIQQQSNSHPSQLKFHFVPGPGQHFLLYQGYYISVQRIREQQMVDLNTGRPWEKVVMMTLGQNTRLFENILQEAYQHASQQEEGKMIIFTNWGTEWRPFGHPRRRRPLDSVILDEGVSQRIYEDVLQWKESASWYIDKGIPYRRGYLLYGPPGSGKTSYIMVESQICT